MKKRYLAIIILSSILFSILSWYVFSDSILFKNPNILDPTKGFPFVFFDYRKVVKFSFLYFTLNIGFYFISLYSIVCIVNYYRLTRRISLVILTELIFVCLGGLSIFGSHACVAGYPVHFYEQCEGRVPITQEFARYGIVVDFIFWLMVSAISAVLIYFILYNSWLKKIYSDPKVWLTLRVSWLVITAVTILGMIYNVQELALGVLFSLICFLARKEIKNFFNTPKPYPSSIYFSVISYAVAGIFFGLAVLALLFNLIYEGGGWFDFTDMGFALIAMPLSYLIKLEIDNSYIISRLYLYGVVVLNFFLVTYAVDLIMFSLTKAFRFLKGEQKI